MVFDGRADAAPIALKRELGVSRDRRLLTHWPDTRYGLCHVNVITTTTTTTTTTVCGASEKKNKYKSRKYETVFRLLPRKTGNGKRLGDKRRPVNKLHASNARPFYKRENLAYEGRPESKEIRNL